MNQELQDLITSARNDCERGRALDITEVLRLTDAIEDLDTVATNLRKQLDDTKRQLAAAERKQRPPCEFF
jgi:hypothetical protein